MLKNPFKKKEAVEEVEEKEKTMPLEGHENAYVSLQHIDKIYDNNVQAVFDFNLDIKKHEFIVFVGPSGCGKSTTLRMIAGLEDITSGELYIDGEFANEKTPKDRDIAMVFQSYALYPHMTVYDNMAFGLKIRHLNKQEIDKRVHEAAKILQIEEYLDRKPKALSGGQRQRVALGRAIVRNAKVFLMDEPLSNLDAKLRVQMRSQIIKLHEALNATTIYVTHDQTEAMTMATRIVVMKAGYIQQIGTPMEIYTKPANMFVASFIGSPAMNLMKATYDGDSIVLMNNEKVQTTAAFKKSFHEFYEKRVKVLKEELKKLKGAPVEEEKKRLSLAKKEDPAKKTEELIAAKEKELASAEAALETGKGSIIFGIRPEDIHEGKAHKAMVSVAELLGHEYYIHCDFCGIDLVAKLPLTHEIKIGDSISYDFDIEKAHVFDPNSELRIA